MVSESEKVHTSLNLLRLVAITVFVVVWSVQMYLSIFGPPAPSPATGAIYPVTIHGGVTYATTWQHYFASRSALAVAITLFGLNIVLRRLYMSSKTF
jgi:hypothetical protein